GFPERGPQEAGRAAGHRSLPREASKGSRGSRLGRREAARGAAAARERRRQPHAPSARADTRGTGEVEGENEGRAVRQDPGGDQGSGGRAGRGASPSAGGPEEPRGGEVI